MTQFILKVNTADIAITTIIIIIRIGIVVIIIIIIITIIIITCTYSIYTAYTKGKRGLTYQMERFNPSSTSNGYRSTTLTRRSFGV